MPLIINDERIEDGAIAQEIQAASAQQREHPDQFGFDSQEELTEYAKENVVCRVLLQQEAAKTIASVPPEEVDAAFGELKEQYGGEKEFYEAHEIDASHDAEIRGNLERNLKVQKLMDQLCEDVAEPTEDEALAHYEANRDQFVYPKQVHAAHIVKRPGGEADAEAVFAEMVEVRKKLLAGAEVADLAGEHSDCTDNGGDLGFFSPGQMVEEFEAVVFSMDEGEVSPVVLTQFGYHVIKVHEHRPERPCPFEDVREDIAERLLHDRKNDRIGEFVDGVKKRSVIIEFAEEPPEPPADSEAEQQDKEGSKKDAPRPKAKRRRKTQRKRTRRKRKG